MEVNRYLGFESIWHNGQWRGPLYFELDSNGIIQSISDKPIPQITVEYVKDFAIPSFQNAHSHAFQYAMNGLAEYHHSNEEADDFWSWREAMYRIALHIKPEELEAIAGMLYSEMLRHGYTHVAEFHYLHHDSNGKSYAQLSEMGERLMAAAQKVGMRITLLPMFYRNGGFGEEAKEGQRRFISQDLDSYARLFESSQKAASNYNLAFVGMGFHSLRAASITDIKDTLALRKNEPIHIHISEQLKEVEECLAYSGKRPVELLSDSIDLNSNWHLVHATHLTENEVLSIAKSGAHVVLCPTTEGNLGDGLFPLKDFVKAGGRWSIGTDSHIGLSPMEEFRMLDYGQRLTLHTRNTFVNETSGDSAANAIRMAWKSGRSAMGVPEDSPFEIGQPLDLITLDANCPLLASASSKNRLNTFLYSGDPSWISGTMTGGQWKVKNQQHSLKESIHSEFVETLKKANFR